MNEELKNETLADFMTPPSAQAVPVLTLDPVTSQPP